MKKYLFTFFIIVGIIGVGCNKNPDEPIPKIDFKITKLIDNGGRVAWYKGSSHSKILFDRITDPSTRNTDLFLMNGDGSDIQCLTCGLPDITGRFVGQPEWLPDGIHCIIQVENGNSNHTQFEHMAWGFNNDLWLLNTQTLVAEKIFATDLNHAALHPHFNANGSKLLFANRIPTGNIIPVLIGITPGGENHWDGWGMHIADFDMSQINTNKLSNHLLLKPNGTGFYETHSIEDKLMYSYTPNGQGYVDDCYQSDLDGNNITDLINRPSSWEEHASFSPSKKNFIFISSRHDNSWNYPGSTPSELSTELYIKNMANGEIQQLTKFNQNSTDFKILTSDFDWNREGDKVVFLVAKRSISNPSLYVNEIWQIEFNEPKYRVGKGEFRP
jgi:Tol biopolymer transport system component